MCRVLGLAGFRAPRFVWVCGASRVLGLIVFGFCFFLVVGVWVFCLGDWRCVGPWVSEQLGGVGPCVQAHCRHI